MAATDMTREALGGGVGGQGREMLWDGGHVPWRGGGWTPGSFPLPRLPANSRAPQGMFSCFSLMA